jgi:hypothetical protein
MVQYVLVVTAPMLYTLPRRQMPESVGAPELVDGRLDAFWIFAIMALGPLPLILLVKRSVARGEVAAH